EGRRVHLQVCPVAAGHDLLAPPGRVAARRAARPPQRTGSQTMSDVTNPEAVLCAGYREQAEHYCAAVALAETFPAAVRAGRDIAEPLGGVMAGLGEVAAVEQRLGPVKERWGNGGAKPGAELCSILTEVTHLIERLATSLAEAEVEAAVRQAELLPQMET